MLINQRCNFWLQKFFLIYLFNIITHFIKDIQIKNNCLEIKVRSKYLYPISLFLQKHSLCQYKALTDIVAYDTPGKKHRFTLFYYFLSVQYNMRMILCFKLMEVFPVITSITSLFGGAGWLEREAFDLFGFFFLRNLDLRRILTDYGFIGHPFRKDFPLTGFIEVLYDDSQKLIIYKPVELSQDFRNFNFKNI